MDIQEVRKLKLETEERITKELKAFIAATGLEVENLRLFSHAEFGGDIEIARVIIEAKL
jgi:hypothetical protein